MDNIYHDDEDDLDMRDPTPEPDELDEEIVESDLELEGDIVQSDHDDPPQKVASNPLSIRDASTALQIAERDRQRLRKEREEKTAERDGLCRHAEAHAAVYDKAKRKEQSSSRSSGGASPRGVFPGGLLTEEHVSKTNLLWATTEQVHQMDFSCNKEMMGVDLFCKELMDMDLSCKEIMDSSGGASPRGGILGGMLTEEHVSMTDLWATTEQVQQMDLPCKEKMEEMDIDLFCREMD